MITWPDVLLTAVLVAGACFHTWCFTRPSK